MQIDLKIRNYRNNAGKNNNSSNKMSAERPKKINNSKFGVKTAKFSHKLSQRSYQFDQKLQSNSFLMKCFNQANFDNINNGIDDSNFTQFEKSSILSKQRNLA